MNISLRGMITDHLSDTYVPGTNGHTSIGFKTLTTSGAGSLSETGRASPYRLGSVGSHSVLCQFLYHPARVIQYSMCFVIYIIFIVHILFRVLVYLYCSHIVILVTLFQNIIFCIFIVRSSPSLFVLN